MRHLSLLLSILSFSQLFSQSTIPDNQPIQSTIIQRTCPYDDSQMVWLPENWDIYQTQNDRWDGIPDSNNCLSLIQVADDWELNLEDIDPSRSLFFRYRFAGTTALLPANAVYRNTGNYWTDAPVILSDSCNNEICSGMIAVYSLPDDNDSLVYRTVAEVSGQYK